MGSYKCKLVPLERLLVGPVGVMQPLCNNCETRDCENPIQPTQVTVFGKNVTWRIYKKASNASIVVHCEGYSQSDAHI